MEVVALSQHYHGSGCIGTALPWQWLYYRSITMGVVALSQHCHGYFLCREEATLVDVFAIEMMIVLIGSLRLAHADSKSQGESRVTYCPHWQDLILYCCHRNPGANM